MHPWVNYFVGNRLRILMYHSISDAQNVMSVEPSLFAAQMEYLAQNNFRVVPLHEAYYLMKSKSDLCRTIVLTFDDGYHDFLSIAVPIMKRYDFTATLFVVTGRVGQTSSWSRYNNMQSLLSEDELHEIKKMGFYLGSHSVTHADLTALDDAALRYEVEISRASLEKWENSFIPFSYPGGAYTQREIDAVSAAGYDCAVIVGGRWGNGYETSSMLMRREPVLGSDTLEWFRKRVNGHYEWHYVRARARGIQTR